MYSYCKTTTKDRMDFRHRTVRIISLCLSHNLLLLCNAHHRVSDVATKSLLSGGTQVRRSKHGTIQIDSIDKYIPEAVTGLKYEIHESFYPSRNASYSSTMALITSRLGRSQYRSRVYKTIQSFSESSFHDSTKQQNVRVFGIQIGNNGSSYGSSRSSTPLTDSSSDDVPVFVFVNACA